MNYNQQVESIPVQVLSGTPAELSEQTGISKATLSILLRLAERTGDAKVICTVKKDGARGKASNVWQVNSRISIDLMPE